MYSTFILEVHTEDLNISELDCIRKRKKKSVIARCLDTTFGELLLYYFIIIFLKFS
jgi:hypothetical protein